MATLSISQRNKLQKFIRAKHGNLKKACDITGLSITTLTKARQGMELSEPTLNVLKLKLPNLN